MNITVECIHKAKALPGPIEDNTIWGTDDTVSDYNQITCRINSDSLGARFLLPKDSIILNDAMNFCYNMSLYRQYDCVLEIASFTQVELFTNHRYSIRGKYWSPVPQKYLYKYQLYKERECIEIGNDILLISIYNNMLTNRIADGETIEIIVNFELNLICAENYPYLILI